MTTYAALLLLCGDRFSPSLCLCPPPPSTPTETVYTAVKSVTAVGVRLTPAGVLQPGRLCLQHRQTMHTTMKETLCSKATHIHFTEPCSIRRITFKTAFVITSNTPVTVKMVDDFRTDMKV